MEEGEAIGAGLLPGRAARRELVGIYRAAYINKLREYFQQMLAEAYSVYVTALDEGFEPPLKAHLTDILQDIIVRTPELAEVFELALLDHFETTLDSYLDNGDPVAARADGFEMDIEGDSEVRGFVAKTVRTSDTQHGSIILAVTKVFAKFTGRPAVLARPPWGAACLFAAFAETLKRIEVPIHGRVKLALYKAFSQAVLKHIGDACLSFRDALSGAALQPGPPPPDDGSALGLMRAPKGNGGTLAASAPDNSHSRPAVKSIALVMVLLGILGIAWAIGWLDIYPSRPAADFLPSQTPAFPPTMGNSSRAMTPEPKPMVQVQPETPPVTPVEPLPSAVVEDQAAPPVPVAEPATPPAAEPPKSPPSLDGQGKRNALREVKLRSFKWRVDPKESAILFDLRIENAGRFRVGRVEVVCAQYSRNKALIEAAKRVLGEPIEPGQSRDFPATVIGYASQGTYRVSCMIADLEILPDSR